MTSHSDSAGEKDSRIFTVIVGPSDIADSPIPQLISVVKSEHFEAMKAALIAAQAELAAERKRADEAVALSQKRKEQNQRLIDDNLRFIEGEQKQRIRAEAAERRLAEIDGAEMPDAPIVIHVNDDMGGIECVGRDDYRKLEKHTQRVTAEAKADKATATEFGALLVECQGALRAEKARMDWAQAHLFEAAVGSVVAVPLEYRGAGMDLRQGIDAEMAKGIG